MVHLLANKTNFATKGFALDLVLKRAKDNPENVLLCRLWRISNCYDIISILSSVVLMCFEDNDCVSMFVMMKSHISNKHANYQNVRVFWFGSSLLSIDHEMHENQITRQLTIINARITCVQPSLA